MVGFANGEGEGEVSGVEADGKVVLVNIVILELRIPKMRAVATYMAKLKV